MKTCFVWKSNNIFHVVDVFGFCYGEGHSPKEAIQHAITIGVDPDCISGEDL